MGASVKTLKREVQANNAVLKTMKKELDLSSSALEKALATGAQRETDLQELKGEFDELEGKLLEARKEMDSVEQAKKALEVAMKDQARKINGMAVENKEKEAAWVEQEREGRKETAARF